jgi:hypothetical protein
MAKILKIDGSEELLEPKNGRKFSLEELQGVVGGYIQLIELDDNRMLVVNEEGQLKGLKVNKIASDILRTSRPNFDPFGGNILVGDILFTSKRFI